jgi:hypothetical protein
MGEDTTNVEKKKKIEKRDKNTTMADVTAWSVEYGVL